eukprot:TRINITY_DN73692_c0_g1_i1.p1 TRINITY_DN73692_c0_g1~~TRINITY_DN73692_c0_g1_i1.p1  ORF type:complete len:649 (-),score=158.03 TRINITY_DN73692_c0_g1_i1:25-1971(-)
MRSSASAPALRRGSGAPADGLPALGGSGSSGPVGARPRRHSQPQRQRQRAHASPRSPTRAECRLSPASVTEGLCPQTRAENQRRAAHLGSAAAGASPGAASPLAAALPRDVLDEDAFMRETGDVEAYMRRCKQDLDGFELLSPAERKVREKQRQLELSCQKGVAKKISRREFMAYKYTRVIEPPLPPLERPPPPEHPEEGPDQTTVIHNAMPDTLELFEPRRRRKDIATRAKQHEDHVKDVRTVHRERLASKLHAKFLDAQRAAGLLNTSHHDADEGSGGRAGQWLWRIAALKFAQNMFEFLRIQKMTESERLAYAMEQCNGARMWLFASRSPELKGCVKLNHDMLSPGFVERIRMLAEMARTNCRLRQQRQNALVVHKCLSEWSTVGKAVLRLRAIPMIMLRVQRWWRNMRRRLQETREKVSKQWVRVETEDNVRRIRDEDSKAPVNKALQLPMSQRIELRMVKEAHRLDFITHELRARRYMLLPALMHHEREMAAWNAKILERRATRRALVVMHGEVSTGPSEHEVFFLPPTSPSHLPSDQELLQMIHRARKNPGGGWTDISQLDLRTAGLGMQQGQERRRPSSGDSMRREPHGPGDEALLRSVGLDLRKLPAFHGQKPPTLEAGVYYESLRNSSPQPTPRPLGEI